MTDPLDDVAKEFAALVESVRKYRDLPCICVHTSVKAEEESLASCTPCHLDSLFDETLEHARGIVDFIEGMAENHPAKPPVAVEPQRPKPNVVRFHPMGREPQPQALWDMK